MENGKQLPTDSTDLIITDNKTKEIEISSLNTCKSVLIIFGLLLLFIIIFGLCFGLGIYVGPRIIQQKNEKNEDLSLPFLPSETSKFELIYQISVLNGVPKDEIRFRILVQIEKDLSQKLGDNYHRYFVNSIDCNPNQNFQICSVNSSIKFRKKIIYEDQNNLDIGKDHLDKIIQYLRTNPLKNLNIIADSSDLLNKNQKDLLTNLKSSGNLELGSICNNDNVCDLNMECRKELNQFNSRCRCKSGFTSIISTKTGYFECIKSRLNYQDFCSQDSDCHLNSICSKRKCACRQGFTFKKGLCVSETNEMLSCNTDNDCLTKSPLMKCTNSICTCAMGYHLEDSFCVSGSVKLNSFCTVGLECGLNAHCSIQKTCVCQLGMSSSNEFDCYLSTLATSRIFFQFIYQDTLVPADDLDQIMSFTRNTYDQILFKYSNRSVNFASYRMLNLYVFEFTRENARWFIHLEIEFDQPIKLSENLFKSLVSELMSAKDIKLVTLLNSNSYLHSEFMKYFYDIYSQRTTSIKQIDEQCQIDTDCIDRNSSCIITCSGSNCTNTAKTCKCKIGFYEAIDTKNNQIYCEYGKKLKSQCFIGENIPCGKYMVCSQGFCACIPGYVTAGDSCILQNDFLPNNGCGSNNECPIYAKCQQGLCICYSGYTLVNGLCKHTRNQILEVSSDSCLGQTYCGQNAFCNQNSLICKCLNGFQVAQQSKEDCTPICNCS